MPDPFEPREDRTTLADAVALISIGCVLGMVLVILAILPLLKPGVVL